MAAKPGMNYIPVVIDNGSMVVKAGYGGEEAPRELIPTLSGHPRHSGVTGNMLGNTKDGFCGNDALASRGLLSTISPITRGRVTSWESMEALWHHALFSTLEVTCEEHPMLFTETPDNTRQDREKLATTAFENLNIPALVVYNTSALSLFSTGRSTGLVVESGATRTHIGPVWDGYTLPHYQRRIDYGGEDITARMVQLLRSEGYPFSSAQDRDAARLIKEQLCYVAGDPEFEKGFCVESRSVEKLFRLPDGQEVYLNENRFTAPEILLSPKEYSAPMEGWHEVINETIQCCDPSIRPELYASVVLGGGNTLFPKLDERIQREVSLLAPKGIVTKCVAFRNRLYGAWIGGSIIGSLSTFPCMWVSKAEYDEHGPSIIHRKTL
eukprot:GDKK01067493.1.p1 GENE.GDKK01067493.1~~GDKK01067493.1.p1  ORF type:complete len:382 (-),score=-15.22 GDKK01067493.1:54-1199(-)